MLTLFKFFNNKTREQKSEPEQGGIISKQPRDEDTSQEVSGVTSSIPIDPKTGKWNAPIDWRISGSY